MSAFSRYESKRRFLYFAILTKIDQVETEINPQGWSILNSSRAGPFLSNIMLAMVASSHEIEDICFKFKLFFLLAKIARSE